MDTLKRYTRQWLTDRVSGLEQPVFIIDDNGITHANKAAYALELMVRLHVLPHPSSIEVVQAYTEVRCELLMEENKPFVKRGMVRGLDNMRSMQNG